MAKKKAELEAEKREQLRLWRIRNYRLKRQADFRCATCGSQASVVVVRVSDGNTDDDFSVRCPAHDDGLPYAPGQLAAELNGAEDQEAAAG